MVAWCCLCLHDVAYVCLMFLVVAMCLQCVRMVLHVLCSVDGVACICKYCTLLHVLHAVAYDLHVFAWC